MTSKNSKRLRYPPSEPPKPEIIERRWPCQICNPSSLKSPVFTATVGDSHITFKAVIQKTSFAVNHRWENETTVRADLVFDCSVVGLCQLDISHSWDDGTKSKTEPKEQFEAEVEAENEGENAVFSYTTDEKIFNLPTRTADERKPLDWVIRLAITEWKVGYKTRNHQK